MENTRSKSYLWVLIFAWVAVGIILFEVVLLAAEAISAGIFSSKTDVSHNVSRKELRQNKQHFETVADLASDIFKDEYENNSQLTCIVMDRNLNVDYYYTDSSLNKTAVFNCSEDINESFDVLKRLLFGDLLGDASVSVIVNEDQVIFSGYETSVVYNHGIFKPKAIVTHRGEQKIASLRLSLKWFECAPEKE